MGLDSHEGKWCKSNQKIHLFDPSSIQRNDFRCFNRGKYVPIFHEWFYPLHLLVTNSVGFISQQPPPPKKKKRIISSPSPPKKNIKKSKQQKELYTALTHSYILTPLKFNMEPENGPLEKEIPFKETIIFRFYVKLLASYRFYPLVN